MADTTIPATLFIALEGVTPSESPPFPPFPPSFPFPAPFPAPPPPPPLATIGFLVKRSSALLAGLEGLDPANAGAAVVEST